MSAAAQPQPGAATHGVGAGGGAEVRRAARGGTGLRGSCGSHGARARARCSTARAPRTYGARDLMCVIADTRLFALYFYIFVCFSTRSTSRLGTKLYSVQCRYSFIY